MPPKADGISRGSAKSKGRTKAVDRRSVSPPPPPNSVIHTQSNHGAASRKRPRPPETSFEQSKHPRLTQSVTATQSGSHSGDSTSTSGAFDDKSDISSATSSSSAVSRLLVQRRTPSLPPLSTSPSIKSPSSPTSTIKYLPYRPLPIRKFVPHNHGHHRSAPRPWRRASVEQMTQVHLKASLSPSPASQSSQPLSTHKTRASCTDHKVSVPGPDGLLYFLIPKCSLLNPEVEKDNSIVDCGVATEDEVERAIGDLEATHLDSATLGVIRQLAGIQLMREGQVGYLPRPGESFPHRVKPGRAQIHHTSPAQDVPHNKVHLSVSSRPESSHMASLSFDSASSPVSTSGSSFSDMENEKDSPSKTPTVSRAYDEAYETASGNKGANVVEGGSLNPPPSSKSIRSSKAMGSRRRKLRPEDAAYNPDEATESSSDDDNIGGKKRNKRSVKRKASDVFIQDDGISGNAGTPSPEKKRKRKDFERPVPPEGSPKDTTETRRKKARRKKLDDGHADDTVAAAI
ncbi:hypothetical protein JB92DRAFT_913924 [Gautieria morchelliformis]|nr:hypothetical protein JB92DRAFT_913924 [Gautieria morchelliformis]